MFANMGVEKLYGWDDDFVEPANLGNQLGYMPHHIPDNYPVEKMSKADAAVDAITLLTGRTVTAYNERVTEATRSRLRGLVVLCVHDNAIRLDLWNSCFKFNPQIKFLIDPRVAVGKYVCYTACPFNMDDIATYEANTTVEPDPEPGDGNVCRDPTNPLYTPVMAACEAAAFLVTWYHTEVEHRDYDPAAQGVDRMIHPPCLNAITKEI